jgi:hypothetical protein
MNFIPIYIIKQATNMTTISPTGALFSVGFAKISVPFYSLGVIGTSE